MLQGVVRNRHRCGRSIGGSDRARTATNSFDMTDYQHIQARDISVGDKIIVTVMGGEDFLKADEVIKHDTNVEIKWSWGLHVPIGGPGWDTHDLDQEFTLWPYG